MIIKINDDWIDIKNVSRTTVNKGSSNKPATTRFKTKMLISEHSPIRELTVRFKYENIKSWVATHLSRHRWECYISTSRTDRTGIDRSELSQDALVSLDGSINAQELIDTSRKRLCFTSSPETRGLIEELKGNLKLLGRNELSDVLVPNCIYRGGCPEFKECGFMSKFLEHISMEEFTDIEKRYTVYNKHFYKS